MRVKLVHERADQATPHRAVLKTLAVRVDSILEDLRVTICSRDFFSLRLKGLFSFAFL